MRLRREAKTIDKMIALYCADMHGGTRGLCHDCEALKDYALARVGHCRFGQSKPACAKCPVHCYRPDMRERVRIVMRHSGPRMLLKHPLLAVAHLLDSAKSARIAREYKSQAGKAQGQ